MTAKIKKEILDFLETAVAAKIDNFDLHVHDGNKKGEGFLGEMTFVTLKNKQTGEDINLVVKQVHPSETTKTRMKMTSSYFNEIQYYTKIFPALLNFQKNYPKIRKFDNYPKCYATSLKIGFEKLALENLKFKNYEMHPKEVPFDVKSFKKIFRTYAELHALGFAYKYHHPQEFLEITKNLANNFIGMNENDDFMPSFLKHIFGKIRANLKNEGEEKIADKLEKYINSGVDIFFGCVSYKGPYGTILHGDGWSNNMMIKYHESREIEHVKMLDFQLGFVGSPVIDLSYNFYSGAGKESLANLENLLKFYHNALSEILIKYGCNPDKIYPYEVLKKEWKEHCQFGYIMGSIVWSIKFADISEMPTINEVYDNSLQTTETDNLGIKFDEEKYKLVTLDIVRHMDKHDFL